MISYALHPVASAPQPESAVLCRFPHGAPAQLSNSDDFSSITFRLHQHSDSRDTRKATQRLLTADTARVEWTGQNFASSSFKLSPYTYAIGVVQDADRRIDLLPVNHVYTMQQHLKHRLVKPTTSAASEESYATRQKALIDSFGSKKRKSQLASKESNKVIVQQEIADVLDASLQHNRPDPSTAPDDDDDQALLRRTKAALLPPFDEDTDNPLHIYSLDSLIPKPIYSQLQGEAKRLMKLTKDEALLSSLDGKGLIDHQLTRFSVYRLQQLMHSNDEKAVMKDCTLLAFYQFLLTLKTSHPRFPKKALSTLPHPPPLPVLNHLLTQFAVSEGGKWTMDSTGGRRVLCWLLVTSLLVGEGRLGGRELGPVGEDVKLSGGELVGMYREVGCGKASRAEVELTAPLTVGRFRRKKRKAGP